MLLDTVSGGKQSNGSARSHGSSSSGGSEHLPPAVPRRRRVRSLTLGFLFAGAFYLLLIDITALPELYAGAGTALLAALGFEAGREQGFAEMSSAPSWLLRGWRPFARVPGDTARVSLAILQQLAHPRAERGTLRAVPFAFGERDSPRDAGRRALAEALGSLAPNSVVIGVDHERDLLLAHQLYRNGGADAIDVLRLG
jgi:hypothetical protein